ncbi:Tm-1-like ATP-binding domain-containing protein [Luteolibacter sp. Populi]|uniref:Tm-1-like ATP-binding domain-containing protein n=1 Tax=Luteolibacter sp. Populi TaxID=3230487 RepID=UPI0034670B93
MATIAVLGTLDSKGEEHAFVAGLIRRRGHAALLIDVGSGGPPVVAPDVTREEVAAAAGLDLAPLLAKQDRGECVVAMSQAAPVLIARLAAEKRIDGIISLGGGGGTAIATAAMRALPLGFPKLMVSTLASGNTAHYLGTKDIVMMPSIADVAGLNRLSRVIFTRAAGAICGMVEAQAEIETAAAKPLVVASMFGNTTACVTEAKRIIEDAGYEVLVFAATGAGGRSMEALIESGMVGGVLDITTTEWADELAGGVLSAGPDRLDAAARAKVPAVIVPGCLDMVNFGERNSVPQKYSERRFYIHNPQVTLMRTTPEECTALGRILAEKTNAYTAPAAILIPCKAISVISAPGQPFHDAAADEALFAAIRAHAHQSVEEYDLKINDPAFAKACAEKLLECMQANGTSDGRDNSPSGPAGGGHFSSSGLS